MQLLVVERHGLLRVGGLGDGGRADASDQDPEEPVSALKTLYGEQFAQLISRLQREAVGIQASDQIRGFEQMIPLAESAWGSRTRFTWAVSHGPTQGHGTPSTESNWHTKPKGWHDQYQLRRRQTGHHVRRALRRGQHAQGCGGAALRRQLTSFGIGPLSPE